MMSGSQNAIDQKDDSQEVQIDNSSIIINKMAQLYADGIMSDICLVVGKTEYPSHRLILCASSDVFQVMLRNPNWSESQKKRIVLGETPSCCAVFEDFLKYLYTGRIQLDFATVVPLVSLADKYDVKDLLRLGLDYMARNVSTACKKNQAVSWYQLTAASGHSRVANLCRDFIKANLELVSRTIDFPNLELDLLCNIICCNDLVVHDEMAVFECVSRWLVAQRSTMEAKGEENIEVHLDRYVQSLLPHIRFPMMTPGQLANLLLNPLSTSHTDLLVEKIRLALNYHKGQMEAVTLRETWGRERLFTPRLYTTEKFCASLTVDHFCNLRAYDCRSLLFATQKYTAEYKGDSQTEWVADVYPKGVWFQRCWTVYQPWGKEVPECVLKTVRVSLTAKNEEELRVKIGVLVVGSKDGFEHVRCVHTRNYIFSENDQLVNIDDVVDFDNLNDMKQKSHYLTGPEQNSLKVMIVVTPLSKLSSLSYS